METAVTLLLLGGLLLVIPPAASLPAAVIGIILLLAPAWRIWRMHLWKKRLDRKALKIMTRGALPELLLIVIVAAAANSLMLLVLALSGAMQGQAERHLATAQNILPLVLTSQFIAVALAVHLKTRLAARSFVKHRGDPSVPDDFHTWLAVNLLAALGWAAGLAILLVIVIAGPFALLFLIRG